MNKLGGYRLVRKLGTGSRAEVWLGSDGSSTAAIKVYRPDTDSESIDSEIDALGRANSRHVVRLDDLASGPDGMPCLILQRLSASNLGRLLADRRPSPGEAVTILAPLAWALAELHRVGVAHRAVVPSTVLFDEAGAPVLTGFGSAELFGQNSADGSPIRLSPAVLSETESVSADIRGMISLTRLVLGGEDAEFERWLDLEMEHPGPQEFFAELADRLFSLASPTPVSLDAQEHESNPSAVLSRVDLTSNLALESETPRVAETEPFRNTVSGPLSLFHLPDAFVSTVRAWLAGSVSSGGFRALRERIATLLRPVRTPVWVVAGAVAVAIVAFTAVVPSQGPQDASGAVAVPSPTLSPRGSAAPIDPAIFGDDPIAAGVALLRARAECFAVKSVLCLDDVDQHGSAAMDADSYRIRLVQAGGIPDESWEPIRALTGDPAENSAEAFRLILVESLGDTALLTTEFDATELSSAPMTILVIRGDDGWRIRDLMVSDSAAP